MLNAHDLERHRVALTGHCYRMLGSAAEADDAVQETMVRAWRNLEKLEEHAALRTWLYRIATRVCLDARSDRMRRARPMELGPVGMPDDAIEKLPGERWIEPIADASAIPADANPVERAVLRQSIRLAFVAALQHLPPRQRAALILTEVVGFSVQEVAECLETSVAAVNSALQRARATLASQGSSDDLVAEPPPDPSGLIDRYVDAFERYDVDALTKLLRDDATLSMPPYSLWLQGHESIRTWMLGRGCGCRGSRLVRTNASGLPAFGQYRPSGPGGRHQAWALIVLELAGDRIARVNSFLDVEALFPRFGLAAELD